MPEAIILVKLDYAGHGLRRSEPLDTSFEELSSDLCSAIEAEINDAEPYCLFGYSMGALILARILSRLIEDGSPLPTHVFLGAHEPNTKTELIGFSDSAPDSDIIERTIRFGGIDERLANNRTFWRVYLPLFRSDYSLISQFTKDMIHFQTETPATILYSEQDTPFCSIREWSTVFRGECNFHRFEGNHFFINDNLEEIAGIIAKATNLSAER